MFIAGKLKKVKFVPESVNTSIKVGLLVVLMGITWGVASYTYAVALAGEKAAIISLVRNLAFPLTAVMGAYIFKEKISRLQIISLAVVVFAITVGAIFSE